MRVLRTPNTYHRLAVKLYRFLSRRTDARVNSLILKRLMNSRVHRAPISIARLAKFAQRKSYSTANKAYFKYFSFKTLLNENAFFPFWRLKISQNAFKFSLRIIQNNKKSLFLMLYFIKNLILLKNLVELNLFSLLSEPSLMISDNMKSLKSTSAPWDSPKKPEQELPKTEDSAQPLTNWLWIDLMEKTLFYWEDLDQEKLYFTSDLLQEFQDLPLSK